MRTCIHQRLHWHRVVDHFAHARTNYYVTKCFPLLLSM